MDNTPKHSLSLPLLPLTSLQIEEKRLHILLDIAFVLKQSVKNGNKVILALRRSVKVLPPSREVRSSSTR